MKEHIVRERNPLVIKNAKIAFFKKHGRLFCEACGFDFYEVYGEIGKNFIERHHTKMVSQMNEGDITKIEDIAMLYCNFHKIIHNNKNLYSVNQLKEIIKSRAIK